MEYRGLTEDHKREIRRQHVLDLEARLYALELQEEEEPGQNPKRVFAMDELVRRIGNHYALLPPAGDADHHTESTAHGEVDPTV